MIRRNKRTADDIANHAQDVYTDLGYDYRDTVFKKTLSNSILNNETNKNIIDSIQKMIVYLIDTVKQIKLQYMISLNKNDRNVN